MSSEHVSSSLAAVLARVDRLRAEREHARPVARDREERIWQKFRLDWNYHSNAIEGNSLEYGETLAFLLHGITAKGKPLKDYLDIRGHDQVITYLRDFVHREAELTEADIREIHKIILVEPYDIDAKTPGGAVVKKRVRPGEYKQTANYVETRTGELHHFVPPEQVAMRMGDLMRRYREQRDDATVHPIVLAARVHHELVSIHPFDDGNGRMARILMNLILMQRDYLPAIIRTDERNAYYLALAQADSGNPEPLVELIAECELRSLETWLRGARGEDIAEPSDLDKGIALLEQKLSSAPEALHSRRTPELIREFLQGPIGGFLAEVESVMAKFDRFFLQPRERMSPELDRRGTFVTRDDHAALVSSLVTLAGDEDFSECILFHRFQTYRSENDPFDVAVRIGIVFDEFRYHVNFAITDPREPDSWNNYNRLVFHEAHTIELMDRKYHESITAEQAQQCAKRIGQALLGYLNARHEDPTYGSLELDPETLAAEWVTFTNELIAEHGQDVDFLVSHTPCIEASGLLIREVNFSEIGTWRTVLRRFLRRYNKLSEQRPFVSCMLELAADDIPF